MSGIILAGITWQVNESGTAWRDHGSADLYISVVRPHRGPTAEFWGEIEDCGHTFSTKSCPTQEAAAVAVLALARKRAGELLELAGGAEGGAS